MQKDKSVLIRNFKSLGDIGSLTVNLAKRTAKELEWKWVKFVPENGNNVVTSSDITYLMLPMTEVEDTIFYLIEELIKEYEKKDR